MRVRVDGETFDGRAVDLRAAPVDPDPEAVVAAVRAADGSGPAGAGVTVRCPVPGPVHERVGLVVDGMGLETRTALALAARSRGLAAPQDPEIDRLEARLDDLTVPDSADGWTDARRRLAGTDAEVERLRERVAEHRGRLAVLRERDADTAEAEAAHEEAVRALAEAETERAAAEQAGERVRRELRAARDARERRFRLEDRLANRRRAARRHLVDRLRPAFVSALRALPGQETVPADPLDAGPVPGALAVARVAAVDAPVVLACDRFPDAETAAAWLDAPVVRL